MKILHASLIAILLTCSCAFQSNPPDTNRAANFEYRVDDYEVYSAFINTFYTNERFGQRKLIICSETTVDVQPITSIFSLNEIGNELVESFETNNRLPLSLESRFNISRDYQLISQKNIDDLLNGKVGFEAEQIFKREFPDAMFPVYFSRIGYGQNNTKAVFYFVRSMAESLFVVVSFRNNRWEMEQIRQSSIV
jgi:hypothetical protein